MKPAVEFYKGIEFVRLSAMPDEHATLIRKSPISRKIIKIQRDHELLSDCLLYSIYLEWYHTVALSQPESAEPAYLQALPDLKLVSSN